MDKDIKLVLGVIGIGVSTLIVVIVSYLVFAGDIDVVYGYWRIKGGLNSFISILSWIIAMTLAIYICYKSAKHCLRYPFDFFLVWVIFLTILCLTIISGRSYLLFIFFIHGLPALGVSYFIVVIASNSDGVDLKPPFKTYHLAAFYVLAVGGYFEIQNTSWANYEDDRYDIEVNSYTIPTFLDWQVNAEIEIEDKILDKSLELDFWFGQGPYFGIYRNTTGDSVYLCGHEYNAGHNWLIDMNKGTIKPHSSSCDLSNLVEIAMHGKNFELTKMDISPLD